MTLDTLITFTILELLLCLSPGPAVIFVTSTAAAHGIRAAWIATAGILTSNLMYFVISGSGVAAVLQASSTMFNILRWGGSLYLLVLGVRMFFNNMALGTDKPTAAPLVSNNNISIVHGFMVQTLNPKAIAFFAALLPQFVNPALPLVPQMTILTMTSLTVETTVMAFYIWMTHRFGQQTRNKGNVWIKRLGGGFLMLAASRLAWVG